MLLEEFKNSVRPDIRLYLCDKEARSSLSQSVPDQSVDRASGQKQFGMKRCRFCRKLGHVIADCEKRKKKDAAKLAVSLVVPKSCTVPEDCVTDIVLGGMSGSVSGMLPSGQYYNLSGVESREDLESTVRRSDVTWFGSSHGALSASNTVSSVGSGDLGGAARADALEENQSPKSEMIPVAFQDFVMDGVVALKEGFEDEVSVKVLRDTACLKTLIVADSLPFSEESSLHEKVIIGGVNGDAAKPLHLVHIKTPLVSGCFPVAVVNSLPTGPSIKVFWGNDIAGKKVHVQEGLCVADVPTSDNDEEEASELPGGQEHCTTRHMCQSIPSDESEHVSDLVPVCSETPSCQKSEEMSTGAGMLAALFVGEGRESAEQTREVGKDKVEQHARSVCQLNSEQAMLLKPG